MECLEKQESHWGYRRESHKADGGLAGEGRKSERLSVSGYPGREGGGTKSESRLEVFSEGTDGEIVTRVEKSICARNSRGEENSVPKNGYPLIPGAAVDVDEKGTELCHPSGEEVSFCELPWVSRGATHGCSVGIPPGCAPHETREIPESGGTDSAQNADGEIVMRDKNVKIQAAVGSQRASGSGGGKVMCPVCAGVFHDRGRIPESGGKDLAQNADGEIVTRVKKVICWPMAPWHEGFATRNLRGREPPPELGLPKPGIPFANLSKDRASETRIGWANSIGRSSRLPHAGPPAV